MSAEKDCDGVESTASEPLNSVVDEVRRFTVQRLEAGLSPSELSFALTFVATEMGLCVTRGANSLPVFQAVLQAVTAAAMNGAPDEPAVPDATELVAVPVGTIVH